MKSKEASALAAKRYREAHPDRVRESTKRYREANAEKLNATNKKWRQANRQRLQVYEKERRQAKRERWRILYSADLSKFSHPDYYKRLSEVDLKAKRAAEKRIWRKANSVIAKELDRARYKRNREKLLMQLRMRRNADPEKYQKAAQKWRDVNPEKARHNSRASHRIMQLVKLLARELEIPYGSMQELYGLRRAFKFEGFI